MRVILIERVRHCLRQPDSRTNDLVAVARSAGAALRGGATSIRFYFEEDQSYA